MRQRPIQFFVSLFILSILSPIADAQLFSVSDTQVIAAGRQAHAQVMKQYGGWHDPVQQERVDRLGRRLAEFSERPEIHYRFYLLNSNILNAMATPDGSIHVTKGLATHFTDDNELSFILGHEITHVEKRHGKQQIEKTMQTRAAGNILLSVLGRGSILNQIGVGGASYWLTTKYSRDFENQADEGGVRLINKEGIDPHYGPKALRHLEELSKAHPGLMQTYFGSHPLTPERVTRTQTLADSLSR